MSKWAIAKTINHGLLLGAAPTKTLSPALPQRTGGGSNAFTSSPSTLGEDRGEGPSKCFFEAEVIDPTGRAWTIGVLHLHAHALEEDERRREREIAGVLDVFARHRLANHPHLLVGDFNSNSPDQQIDPAKCYPTTRQEWHANGGQIPRRVVQKILDAGYIDTYAAFDPHAAATTGTFTTQFPGQRVDYVFAFGFNRSSIRNAWIEQDRLAKYASDHFPIGVEIA